MNPVSSARMFTPKAMRMGLMIAALEVVVASGFYLLFSNVAQFAAYALPVAAVVLLLGLLMAFMIARMVTQQQRAQGSDR